MLPEERETAVRGLTAGREHVVLVGDAPAPALAHVGIALGAADADLTVRAADAVVMRDPPRTPGRRGGSGHGYRCCHYASGLIFAERDRVARGQKNATHYELFRSQW